jgi:hypothetical protein
LYKTSRPPQYSNTKPLSDISSNILSASPTTPFSQESDIKLLYVTLSGSLAPRQIRTNIFTETWQYLAPLFSEDEHFHRNLTISGTTLQWRRKFSMKHKIQTLTFFYIKLVKKNPVKRKFSAITGNMTYKQVSWQDELEILYSPFINSQLEELKHLDCK